MIAHWKPTSMVLVILLTGCSGGGFSLGGMLGAFVGFGKSHQEIEPADLPPSLAVTISVPSTDPEVVTNTPFQYIGGSAFLGVEVSSVSWVNEATGQTGTARGTEAWHDVIPLLLGPNPIVVTASSSSTVEAQTRILVTYDPTAAPLDSFPPNLTLFEPRTWTDSSPSLQLEGTATDDTSVPSVWWNNATTGAAGVASGTAPWTAWITLAPGVNVITVTAIDGVGRTAVRQVSVPFPNH